jgi:hypothetical protein
MESFKTKYYSENNKNRLFKKSQKIDFAKQLTNSPEFNLEIALQNTIYIITNSNKIFFNYEIFKYYAHPENYSQIVDYILSLILLCISKFETFEMHININSFTVSSAERYKEIIKLFMNKCMSNNTQFSQLLTSLILYNAPSMMNEISILLKPFIDPIILNKITIHNKNNTPDEYTSFIKN